MKRFWKFIKVAAAAFGIACLVYLLKGIALIGFLFIMMLAIIGVIISIMTKGGDRHQD